MSLERFDLPSGTVLHPAWCSSARDSDIDLEIKLVATYLSRLAAARNTRSGLLRLPAELLDIVLDDVYADYGKHAMRACALACKHLAPFAQARMFSTLQVTTPRECVRAAELAKERPDLCRRVVTLKICDQLDNPDGSVDPGIPWENCTGSKNIDQLFAALERVETLHIKSIVDEPRLVFKSGYSWTPAIAGVLGRIKHLVLERCHWDRLTEFNDFILQFADLDTLELIDLDVGTRDEYIDQPLQIRGLKVDQISYKANVFSWFQNYIDTENLLSLECPCLSSGASPDNLIEEMGSHLQRVFFTGYSELELRAALVAVSEVSTVIQEIAIRIEWYLQETSEFYEFVESLADLKLGAKTLVLSGDRPFGLDPDLETVCNVCRTILDVSSFPALRTLRFDLGPQETVQVLRDLKIAKIFATKTWTSVECGYEYDVETTHEVFDLARILRNLEDGEGAATTRSVELYIAQASTEWPHHFVEEEWDHAAVTISITLGPDATSMDMA